MSLVGNFAFNNYDAEARSAGAGLGGTAFSRPSVDDAASPAPGAAVNEGRTRRPSFLSRQRTVSRDGPHRTSTDLPSVAQPHPHPESCTLEQPGLEAHSGIHDGTYYPDGIPPVAEYATESRELSSTEAGSEDDEVRRDREVLQLARRFTTESTRPGYENPLEAGKDSPLDPHSPNFKARAWAKSFMKLHQRDAEKYPERTAGVAFKNLNVHGYGAATDYQKSVGNIWLEAIGIARRILGVGQRRIEILKDFDGLVHSGEMLVVLGPPGSGCSTFLKTITGETHGFVVDDKSYLNYQGSTVARES